MRLHLPGTSSLLLAIALLAPAAAAAAPANDNYLASTRINDRDGALPREYRDEVDTSTATVQTDIFNPNREGQPLGGGPREITSCPGGTSYGATAWWDFEPLTDGGVEIQAAGFDAVVAVYEWSERNSLITRRASCQNDTSGPAENILLDVERRTNYTVQVGGVSGIGGRLAFTFTFFPDRDGDGVLDEQPDECPGLAGIPAFGGCPPTLRAVPRYAYDEVPGGVRLTRLVVDRVSRGGRVVVSCRSCGRVSVTARRAGTLSLRRLLGRVVRNGDAIVIRATQPRSRSGRYREGAFGRHYTLPVRGGRIGRRVDRCLAPNSTRRVRCP